MILLAEIPGVARNSIRNEKELEKWIMALYKKIYIICKGFNPRRKRPRYSLDRRLGGPQNRSGRCGEEKHLAPANPVCPARSPPRRHEHRSDKNTCFISASRPDRFTPGERAPGTHWIGGWVGPRTGLDVVVKRNILPLPGIQPGPSSP
jgi:hypothetical protein